jgi:hypothetical protein
MNIKQLKNSKFLKRDDVGSGVLVTITKLTQENVAVESAPEELKWCLHVHELDKPMVLNSTNGNLLAKICGSEETDDWVGKQIVLYDDPSIAFQGKLVGGIRCRAPKNRPAAAPAAPKPAIVYANPSPIDAEDAPF